MPPDWVQKLMAAARDLMPRDFVGQIEINAFKGGVSNVNVRQSFKGDQAGSG